MIELIYGTYKFLSEFDLKACANNAATRTVWNYNSALGTTIKDKFESLYIRVVETTHILISKGAQGYFWMVMDASVASMFEDRTTSAATGVDLIPMGTDQIYTIGILNRRWQVYADPNMVPETILIGAGSKPQSQEWYGVIKLSDFII